MKIRDSIKSYFILLLLGNVAGIICRLSDFFPYESLWSLSSVATMFGFWIASVTVITYCSSSGRGAFFNSFLYMFGMTVSFYGLKYLLGLFMEQFSGEFPTRLFLAYSVMAFGCGVGSGILYLWNKENLLGSMLCALPVGGMLAEAVGCTMVLLKRQTLLGQTLFDFVFALIFGILLYRKANSKAGYFITLAAATGVVFFVIYRPFLA